MGNPPAGGSRGDFAIEPTRVSALNATASPRALQGARQAQRRRMAESKHGRAGQSVFPRLLPRRGERAAERPVPHPPSTSLLLRPSSLGVARSTAPTVCDTNPRSALGVAPGRAGAAAMNKSWRAFLSLSAGARPEPHTSGTARLAVRPRRALILVENLPSPFDRRVWQEATTLRENGYEVSIVCPTGQGYSSHEEVIDGIHILRYDLPTEASSVLGYAAEY